MAQLLQYFILLPIAGFLITLLIPRKKERIISGFAIGMISLHALAVIAFVTYWLVNDHPVLDSKHAVIFSTPTLEIFIDFYFDKITAAYALIGSVLTFLVAVFSRFYLHREEGFKRFFCTMLVFFTGYNIIIFGGNFETLFVGWELLGISSFLLIAFYRDRYLPVKNSLKVISIYRLSDICLLVAMWLSHHFWHENITFFKMADASLLQEHFHQYYTLGVLIAVMIMVAAVAKSAQLPFSSWLPRAMEGPTTSSAIFYGSLSVHIGVFLLLRTYPFWSDILFIKILIIAIGACTSIIVMGIARVQSSVKAQIAYSSIVQIGIIFVEVALGFHILALVHFAGNAFLRTYQLLVSPSVLSYLVHNQFYHFDPTKKGDVTRKPGKLLNTLYMLSLKEWNLDFYLFRFLWSPFKWIGKQLQFLTARTAIVILLLVFAAGVYAVYDPAIIPASINNALPIIFSLLGFLLIMRSFAERGDARRVWLMIFASQFFVLLSVALNEYVAIEQIFIYLSGTVASAITGYLCLSNIKRIDNNISLNGFHGYTYEKPVVGFVFLLACLGMLGFPITPTFIGVDLLFSHIPKDRIVLIVLTSLSFLFIELSVLRIYARVFMGQHKKIYHAIAYRSS